MTREEELHIRRESTHASMIKFRAAEKAYRKVVEDFPENVGAEVLANSYGSMADSLQEEYHEIIHELSLSHLDN